MPKVSVIIPVYNGERFIKESVHSILEQSFRDFELILVDDGSTDGSRECIAKFDDPRIRRVFRENNGGVAQATNSGLEAAAGQYIALLDQDDIAMPYRLAKQVRFLDANPDIAIAGGQMQAFGLIEGPMVQVPLGDGNIKANLLTGTINLHNPTIMMQRDFILRKALRWEPEQNSAFDWGFFVRAMLLGAKFGNLKLPLTRYRAHQEQHSRNQADIRPILASIRNEIIAAFFPKLLPEERNVLEPLLQWVNPPGLSRVHLQQGLALLSKALTQEGSKYGEDRIIINNYLRTCDRRWKQAMAPTS